MAELRLLSAGPWVSVQDLGRIGHQRHGVSVSGAMDRISLVLANRLVGNRLGVAALEIGTGGVMLEAEGGAVWLSAVGPAVDLSVDGTGIAANRSLKLEPGQRLKLRPGKGAAFVYLGVVGGIDVPPVFGSRAFHARSGLGGLGGKPLGAGARLPVAGGEAKSLTLTKPTPHGQGPIRVIAGPQLEHLEEAAWQSFLSETWRIGARSDRMGVRLDGPRLAHSEKGADTISSGIALGQIQLPGNGQPIVLAADRQTTGGYPRFATVASADLPRLLQCPPGTELRFDEIARPAALAALRRIEGWLAEPPMAAASDATDSAFLLSVNLIDGVVSE